MKRIVTDENWCLGCRLCEVYCVTAHSKSKDIFKAHRRENPKPVSRMVVEQGRSFHIALSCRHCEDAACIKACITGAMHRLPDGTTAVDRTRCIGCMTCVLACPYGALVRGNDEGHTVFKCDLCVETGEPACVRNCPNNALRIVEVE